MKRLLFAAALAIVAVGGALTSQAEVYEAENGGQYNCESVGPLCSTISEDIRPVGTGDYLPASAYGFTAEEYTYTPPVN